MAGGNEFAGAYGKATESQELRTRVVLGHRATASIKARGCMA